MTNKAKTYIEGGRKGGKSCFKKYGSEHYKKLQLASAVKRRENNEKRQMSQM